MPFRDRVRRVLGKSNSSNSNSSKTDTSDSSSGSRSTSIGENHTMYKPGETMPPPRFKNPPSKKHIEALEAFKFTDGERRRSEASMVSPGGSRVASRHNSWEETPAMHHYKRKQAGHLPEEHSHIGQIVQNATDDEDEDEVESGHDGIATTSVVDGVDPLILVTSPTAQGHETRSAAELQNVLDMERIAHVDTAPTMRA